MSENIGRCEEVNEVLKLRCDRSAGHRGVHIQYEGNGVNGWGTFDEMNETVIPDADRRVTQIMTNREQL